MSLLLLLSTGEAPPAGGFVSSILIAGGIKAATSTSMSQTSSIDAAVQAALTQTASANVAVQAAQTQGASLDLALQAAQSLTSSLEVPVQATQTLTASLDANVNAEAHSIDASIDVAVQAAQALTVQANAAVQVTTGEVTSSLSAAIFGPVAMGASLNAAVQQAQSAAASLSAAIADTSHALSASLSVMVDVTSGFFSAVLIAGGIGAQPATLTHTAALNLGVLASQSTSASLSTYVEVGGDPVGGFVSPALIAGGLQALPPPEETTHARDDGIPGAWYSDPGFAAAYAHQHLGTSVARREGEPFVGSISAALDVAIELQTLLATASLNAAVLAPPTLTSSLSVYVLGDFSLAAQLNTAIVGSASTTASVDAALAAGSFVTSVVDTATQHSRTLEAAMDANVADVLRTLATVDAVVQVPRTVSCETSVAVQGARIGSDALLDVFVQTGGTLSATLNAFVLQSQSFARPRSTALGTRSRGGTTSRDRGGSTRTRR